MRGLKGCDLASLKRFTRVLLAKLGSYYLFFFNSFLYQNKEEGERIGDKGKRINYLVIRLFSLL